MQRLFVLNMRCSIIFSFSVFAVLVNTWSGDHCTRDIEIIERNSLNAPQLRHIDQPPFDSLNSLGRRADGEEEGPKTGAEAEAQESEKDAVGKNEDAQKLKERNPGQKGKKKETKEGSSDKGRENSTGKARTASQAFKDYRQRKLKENPNWDRDRQAAQRRKMDEDVSSSAGQGPSLPLRKLGLDDFTSNELREMAAIHGPSSPNGHPSQNNNKRNPVNGHQLRHVDYLPFDSSHSLARRTTGEKQYASPNPGKEAKR